MIAPGDEPDKNVVRAFVAPSSRRPQEVGFSGAVQLAQTGDIDWRLTRSLLYRALDGTVVEVPVDATTDGASVPRPVSWLVPRSGRWLPAAVMHDQCYRVLVPTNQLTYQHADALLLEAMRLLRVAFLLRWTIWAAVRLAGLGRGRAGRQGWWRDLPQVAAVLACPTSWVAVAVSIVVGLGLACWWIGEHLAFGLLWAFGRPDRYVNPPRDLAKS